MELVTASDLFVTASLALLLSFLVAKLVSLAMPGDDPHAQTSTKHAHDHEQVTLQDRLTVQTAQTESMVGFLAPVQVAATNVEMENNREEVTLEPEPNVVELPVKSDITAELSNVVDVLTEAREARGLNEGTEEFVEQAVGSANLGDSAEQRNMEFVEDISVVEQSTEKGVSVAESTVKERHDDDDDVDDDVVHDDDDDDDWEGIERSELEKVFMAAKEFVGSGSAGDRLASVGSDVQMELYGLHKIATEGPCREPQPMALKLSARAKWNAWQKLGNMSPEVAMEQYISLVADKVPGWMKDNSAGMSEHLPTGSEDSKSAAPDLSTFLSHQQMIKTERELQQESGAQDRIPLAESDLENNVKK